MAGKPIPIEVRFWPKVDKAGPLPDRSDPLVTAPETACWLWIGATTSQGYGTISVDGRADLAHRVSLRLSGIRPGEQTDHLCRRRLCVNPGHLEVVTIRENTSRGQGKAAGALRDNVCKWGHPLSGGNLSWTANGRWRKCKECARLATEKYRTRKKEEQDGLCDC